MKGLAIWLAIVAAPYSLVATAEPSSTGDAEEGRRIFAEVARRDGGYGDQQASVAMQLKRNAGQTTTRLMDIAMLEVANDGTRTVVLFNSPPDVKGTRVLTYNHESRDDEQWIYLPAFKRVKQIADAGKTTSFMGSEFTYEDLSSMSVQLDKFSYRYVKTADAEGTSCYLVERTPRYPRSGYKRQVAWIDRDRYTVVKVEYFDVKDTLVKTLTLSKYRQYANAYWRPDEMVMTNQQTGDATLLAWSGYKFKSGLAPNDFSASALKR